MLQELNEDYLLNLCYRLDYEMELRTLAYSVDGEDVWLQPMYLIPMWNILFPTHMYRQPIDLSTVFPNHMIHIKEEEIIFKGEIIKIEYKYVL